MTCPEGLKKS